MIPLKLELKNFLSYGADIQVVDFKDYSLICLSGKNGNGKTALLDAMTWVLWGQARKISGTIKPDEGLLRLGQSRMMVSLEFEFAGNVYRVRREYAKTYGKTLSSLDFEIFNEYKKKFISLTEKTTRLTQAKIEKLLGLDYLTFTNSAFLRQGQADEFSKKSPKERKQILSNILNLSRFDILMSLALQKAKKLTEDYKVGIKLLDNDFSQISKETEVKSLIRDGERKLKNIVDELHKIESKLHIEEKKQGDFFKKKDKFVFLKNELGTLEKGYNLRLKELNKQILAWKNVHYSFLKSGSIKILEEKKIQLEHADKICILEQKKNLLIQESILKQKELYQKKYTDLKDKKNKKLDKLKLDLQKKVFELDQINRLLLERDVELKKKLEKKKATIKELNLLNRSLNDKKMHDKNFENFKKLFEKRRAFYAVLVQRGNWLKSSLTELQDKIAVIKKQESPSCPLCDQVLTVKRKKFLKNKFVKEANILQYRLIRPIVLIKKLKKMLLKQHDEFKQLQEKDTKYKKQILKQEELNNSLIEFEKNISDINKNIVLLQKNKKKFEKIVKKEKNNYLELEKNFEKELIYNLELINIRKKLDNLEKEKKILEYDSKKHEIIQKDLSLILERLDKFKALSEERNLQKERKVKINLLIQQLKYIKNSKIKLKKNIDDLNFDLNFEKILNDNLLNIKKKQARKTMEKDKIVKDNALLEYEFNRINELKKKSEQKKKELEIFQEQIKEYQLLSQAFGKNGIQALLIEQAIPQIEEEANNILAKLTDNQSQIFIESLRDLKSGGVRETLDIKISDSAGIRPYEMFSGGEAFRVDFALRIAISKLLARRAGIALQTLIIDEGFGSQDEDGLARLMDSIYAIKDDFSKVIIVSHLNTFKDNFPVHFVVQKGSSGSFIEIQERG